MTAPHTDTAPLGIRATPQERDDWTEAAEAAGMTRHAWIKAMLNVACGSSRLGDHTRRVRNARNA